MSERSMLRTAIEAKLRKEHGGREAARARMKVANEAAQDWRGRCRHCGWEAEGPLSLFREHKCHG